MNLKPIYGILVVLLIVIIPLFAHLGELPIQQWDEGRLAMKAIEMTESHNWLITTVNGFSDHLSVKPPLLTWIQALFIKLLGANEWAIRLPSALAALATCLFMYWFFAWKFIKDVWLGIICNLLLISCMGYVTLHGTRSGDYDTLLTLFTTGYILCFFLYLEEQRTMYLHVAMLLLTLCVYTKGVQGLMFLPALLLYVIVTKKLLFVFKEKWFYIDGVVFVALVLGYYMARDHYDQGYFGAVIINELGGRYGQVLEGHKGTFFYFFNWIDERAFTYWWPALVGGFITGGLTADKQVRRLVLYLSLVMGVYMFVISSAETKCWWYIMPVMPFMAIVGGIFINTIFKALGRVDVSKSMRWNVLPYLFLIVTALPAYNTILKVTTGGQPASQWDYVNKDMSQILFNVANDNDKSLDGYLVLDNYDDNLTWYREVIKRQHKPIQFSPDKDPGTATKVVAFRFDTKWALDSLYDLSVTYSSGTVNYYTIKGKKTHLPAVDSVVEVNGALQSVVQ